MALVKIQPFKSASDPARTVQKGKRNLFQGVHPSNWDFWVEGVSSSLLGSWINCREQFRLGVIEGWRNPKTPIYFAFGTCGHWVLQHAYEQEDLPSQKDVRSLVGDYEKLWKSEWPNPPASQKQTMEMVYGLNEAILPTYFRRWAGDFPGEKYPVAHNTARIKKWVALEKRFKIQYVYPDGAFTWINGTRDGLFEDKHGDLRVFDSKFRSVINEADTQETLPSDLQQMLYLWSVLEEKGEAPAGTLMNITRRPGHRRGQQESLKEFFARVAKDVSNPRKWDHNFFRIEMDITKKEILQWKARVLDPLMWDIRGWWEGRHPHYQNPHALISKYGRCSLFNAVVHGNFSGLVRRKPGSTLSYQTDVV